MESEISSFPESIASFEILQQRIFMRMPLKEKIKQLSLCLLLMVGSILTAIFARDRIVFLVAAAICAVLFFVFFVVMVFIAFRRRLVVENGNMAYTPLFDKSRKYSCNDITIIHINSYETFGKKAFFFTINFSKGEPIRNIPYIFTGVKEFLALMHDKVKNLDLDE